MAEKKKFTVGVFGVAVRYENGQQEILFNVRTDQEKQKQVAGLPPDSPVKIVDLPGGGVMNTDESLEAALLRECREELGCEVEIFDDELSTPFVSMPLSDIAFVAEITFDLDHVRPTVTTPEHVWLTWQQLEAETEYRLPGKLGKSGRMAKMIQWILRDLPAVNLM